MSDDVTLVRAGTGWWGELARVVVPVQCPGCGAFDVVLCASCRSAVCVPVERCEADAPRLDLLDGRPVLPVWARAAYEGPVREIILAWKDRGRTDLTAVLREDFGAAVGELAPALGDALTCRDPRGDGVASDDDVPRGVTSGASPLLVVGAPSSRGAVRRRGADLVAGLAGAAAAALSTRGVPAVAVAALEQRRGVRDQVGLGARARGRNLSDRVRVRREVRVGGRTVVVVDDVLTTGATLVGAVRALERAGARVVAGFVLAATPGPSRTNRDNQGAAAARGPSGRHVEGPTAGEDRAQRIG